MSRGKNKETTISSEEIIRYQVVEFIEERCGAKKSFDFVPAKWIQFDHKIGKCVAKFMDSIDTPDDGLLMDDLRRTEADAPESWAWYPVVLRGEADNFADAMKEAEMLDEANYAYSTDNENHAKEKSVAVTKIYESKSKKNNSKQLETILSFNDTDSDSQDAKLNSASTESTSNEFDREDSSGVNVPIKKYTKKKTPLRSKPSSAGSSSLVKSAATKSNKKGSEASLPVKSAATKSNKKETASSLPVKSAATKSNPKGTASSLPVKSAASNEKGSKTNVEPDIRPKPKKQNDDEPQAPQVVQRRDGLSDGSEKSVRQPDTDVSKKSLRAMADELPDGVLKLLYIATKALIDEVKNNSEDIRMLRTVIGGVVNKKMSTVRLDTVVEKFGLSLPLESQAQIKDLDEKLSENEQFCTEFVDVVRHFVKSDVCKTIGSILKKLLSRELAMNCTAVKLTGEKYLLKNTKIYVILFELVSTYHKGPKEEEVSEKQFKHALSRVINNAKDWHGHRNRCRKGNAPLPEGPTAAEGAVAAEEAAAEVHAQVMPGNVRMEMEATKE